MIIRRKAWQGPQGNCPIKARHRSSQCKTCQAAIKRECRALGLYKYRRTPEYLVKHRTAESARRQRNRVKLKDMPRVSLHR